MLFVAGDKSKGLLIDVETKVIQHHYTIGQVHRYATVYNSSKQLILANETRGCSIFLSPFMQQPVLRSFTPSPLSSCVLTSCGTFMIAGNELGTLFLWSLINGQLLKNFKAHLRKINCIAVSHSNMLIVTASEDSMCKVWTLSSLLSDSAAGVQPLATFSGHSLSVNCCIFFHHREVVVSGSSDCTCRVFNAFSGEQLRLFTVGDVVTAVAISEDDLDLAIGTSRGYLHFSSFNATGSTLAFPIMPQQRQQEEQMSNAVVSKPREDGHHSPINFLSYKNHLNSLLVLSVSEDGAILLSDVKSGRLFKEVMPPQKWKIHSCCYFDVPVGISKKASCAGLNKNPLDVIDTSYLLYRLEAKESTGMVGKNAAGMWKQAQNARMAVDHTQPAESHKDQEISNEDELSSLIRENTELGDLRKKMVAKLEKIKKLQK